MLLGVFCDWDPPQSQSMENIGYVNLQGDPKKMYHKDSDLKSVIEVRFYFSTCVLESEFRARFILPF